MSDQILPAGRALTYRNKAGPKGPALHAASHGRSKKDRPYVRVLLASLADWRSDHLTGDHELDAPVLLTALSRFVGRRREPRTVASRGDTVRGDALHDEIVTNRGGALLRQTLVDLVGPGRIREAFGLDGEARMGEHDP